MGETAALVARPATISSIVTEELRPLVPRIDTEGLYPAGVLRRLGEAGAFAHHARHLGKGPGGIIDAIAAMAEVGAVCLSTAFCAWCQDALVWYLDRADNAAPREHYLGVVAAGRRLGGTGLSNPMKFFSGLEPLALKGVRVAGGYRVTGRLPFVSNLDEDHLFASIFALDGAPDRKIMALFRAGQDGVRLARNAHFIALEGTGTYSTLIRNAFVADEDTLSDDADRFVPRIRQGFVLLQAGMGLGMARGAARLMRGDGASGRHAAHLPLGPDAIETRAAELEARIAAHAQSAEDPDRRAFLEVLRTRLNLSWLALEAAQAAMLQFGVRGYLVGSEAARRLREAQFVAIITPSVKHILAELARG
ncbi:MAG TPA: acyl-CoA dehydrogenase family protein [Xanthobacteraceae bacterium]|nr:acyl-CoA dehydrogenase family protein [Xanthobacteraceae bacterium]